MIVISVNKVVQTDNGSKLGRKTKKNKKEKRRNVKDQIMYINVLFYGSHSQKEEWRRKAEELLRRARLKQYALWWCIPRHIHMKDQLCG